jgi:hypothetical protein
VGLRLMSQRQSNRFLLTQSLLSSWQWGLKLDNGREDFIKTLRREPIQQTRQMLDGIRFENVLCATLNGADIDTAHEWYKPIMELYPTLYGAQQQVSLSRDVTINGVRFVLYGKLDFLKAGIIFDTKYSKTYRRAGKYLDSPQHPMYFALVPEAYEFQYLICDGTYIYKETYHPDEVEPIEQTIKHFMGFLERQGLVDVYCENWRSKY